MANPLDGLFARDFFNNSVALTRAGINLRHGFALALNGGSYDVDVNAETLVFSDATLRSSTSTSKIQIGANLLVIPANTFVTATRRLRVKVWGATPAATSSIGIDAFNSTPGAVQADLSATAGTPTTASFQYELLIVPTSASAQKMFARLDSSTLPPRLQSLNIAINFALDQTLRLTGLSASGALTINRVEVWSLG